MSKTDKKDYPYIRAWGDMMGSFQYYINDQIEQAREDNAPQNATFRRDDGTWATFDTITREDTKRLIEEKVASMM